MSRNNLKQVICIASLGDDCVLTEVPVVLESIDNEIVSVVDTFVVTIAGVTCGNQVSSPVFK